MAPHRTQKPNECQNWMVNMKQNVLFKIINKNTRKVLKTK